MKKQSKNEEQPYDVYIYIYIETFPNNNFSDDRKSRIYI